MEILKQHTDLNHGKFLKFKTFRNIKQRANFILEKVDKFLDQFKTISIASRIYFFVSYR